MKEIENILLDHNIRPTSNRLLIYRFLKDQQVALALNDIESGFERSDRTTLYRTIKTFEKKGIVHQIDDGTGVPKYALDAEARDPKNLHLHFHCTNCNETVCLTDHKIPHISLPEGYKANEMDLVLKGTCDKCN